MGWGQVRPNPILRSSGAVAGARTLRRAGRAWGFRWAPLSSAEPARSLRAPHRARWSGAGAGAAGASRHARACPWVRVGYGEGCGKPI